VPIVYLILSLLLRNSETRMISMDASPGRRKELLPAWKGRLVGSTHPIVWFPVTGM